MYTNVVQAKLEQRPRLNSEVLIIFQNTNEASIIDEFHAMSIGRSSLCTMINTYMYSVHTSIGMTVFQLATTRSPIYSKISKCFC